MMAPLNRVVRETRIPLAIVATRMRSSPVMGATTMARLVCSLLLDTLKATIERAL